MSAFSSPRPAQHIRAPQFDLAILEALAEYQSALRTRAARDSQAGAAMSPAAKGAHERLVFKDGERVRAAHAALVDLITGDA